MTQRIHVSAYARWACVASAIISGGLFSMIDSNPDPPVFLDLSKNTTLSALEALQGERVVLSGYVIRNKAVKNIFGAPCLQITLSSVKRESISFESGVILDCILDNSIKMEPILTGSCLTIVGTVVKDRILSGEVIQPDRAAIKKIIPVTLQQLKKKYETNWSRLEKDYQYNQLIVSGEVVRILRAENHSPRPVMRIEDNTWLALAYSADYSSLDEVLMGSTVSVIGESPTLSVSDGQIIITVHLCSKFDHSH